MNKRITAALLLLGVVAGFALGVTIGPIAAGEQAGTTEDALVTGIGGVFFKADNPGKLRAWYREHLGIDAGEQGANFFWREADGEGRFGRTVWSVFPENTAYFGPGGQHVMINYRVQDLDALLARLNEQGVRQVGQTEMYWYGRFAWITDIEGNRVELWEPDHFSPRELRKRMQREEHEQAAATRRLP